MVSKRTIGLLTVCICALILISFSGCNPPTSMTEAESEQAAKALYASLGISTQMDEITRALTERDLSGFGTITVGSETSGYVTFTFDSDLTYDSEFEDEVALGVSCEITFEDFVVSYTEEDRAYEYTLNGKALAVFSLFAFDGSGTVTLAIISGEDLVIEGEDLYNLLNAELLYTIQADLTDSVFSISGGFEGTINGHVFTYTDTSFAFSYGI